jgi:hypothetical protein
MPDFVQAYEAALCHSCAKRYQPSMAALKALSSVLGKSAEFTLPKLFPSNAPMGDMTGLKQEDALLPLPIARELAQLWGEAGHLEQDRRLIDAACAINWWLDQWKGDGDLLFYREKDFDENELSDPKNREFGSGIDTFFGAVRLSTASFQSCFTLSGWNTGLGSFQMGPVSVRAFGPQRFPLSSTDGFGIAQLSAHQASIVVDSNALSISGWTRCYADKEIWIFFQASAGEQKIAIDTRFMGILPTPASEPSAPQHFAMAFYVQAKTCTLEDGSVFYPKSLQRFQGKGQKLIFDQTVRMECSEMLNLQVIPLAGFGCFWNTSFLVAFEFSSSQSQASFTFQC